MPKIFGREPVALVGLVEALLAVLVVFDLFGLSSVVSASIVAVVNAGLGVYLGLVTKTTTLAIVTGFAKAALVLAGTLGLDLTEGETGALMTLIALGGAYVLRQNTSPAQTVGFHEEPVALSTVTVVEPVEVVGLDYPEVHDLPGEDDYPEELRLS